MTKEASKQLIIMRKRVQHNKVIKDCYKQIHLMRSHNQQSHMTSEVCLYVIRELFVAKVINDQSDQTINDLFRQLRTEWNDVKWIICYRKDEINSEQLFRQMKQLIDDDRFKACLNQSWYNLKGKATDCYQQLVRDVYFTLNIIDRLDRNQYTSNYKVLVDKNKIYLGVNLPKKEIMTIFKKLDLVNDKSCNFRITHISQPLNLRGFTFKHHLKTNRLLIEVPQHMLNKLSHMFQYGDLHNNRPKARGSLIHQSVREIAFVYHQELSQIANDYTIVNNYKVLNKLFYFAHLSLLKTIARKYSCTIANATKILDNHNISRNTPPKRTHAN